MAIQSTERFFQLRFKMTFYDQNGMRKIEKELHTTLHHISFAVDENVSQNVNMHHVH